MIVTCRRPRSIKPACSSSPSSDRDRRSLNPEHFGEQVLGDLQSVVVAAIAHHEKPTREPLLETVRAIARDRHHDLLEKGEDVGVVEVSEGWHRAHGSCEYRARHPRGGSRDLDEKPGGGTLGAQDGLHTGATLPADRCHFDDAAVRINRHHRDDTAIGKEYMVERTIRVHEDLLALAANMLELRHEPLEVSRWQGEQKAISRPIRRDIHRFSMAPARTPGRLWQHLGWKIVALAIIEDTINRI